jgi:hypothetical protein
LKVVTIISSDVLDRFIPKDDRTAREEYEATRRSNDPVVNSEEVKCPYDTQDFDHESCRVSTLQHECPNQLIDDFGL